MRPVVGPRKPVSARAETRSPLETGRAEMCGDCMSEAWRLTVGGLRKGCYRGWPERQERRKILSVKGRRPDLNLQWKRLA